MRTAAAMIAEDPPKRAGRPRGPWPRGTRIFRVGFDPESCDKICREAEKRQLEPEVLVSRISRVVVNDDLVDAVLDEEQSE